MPRVTFSARPVVWINIKGESQGGFPSCPDGGGLYGRLLKFLEESGIFTAIRTPGHGGGGSFGHAFLPGDAAKVVAWLKEQGCVEDKRT